MILLDCKNFLQGAQSIRELFINLCDGKLVQLRKDNSLGLQQILQIYEFRDIKTALNSISINEYGYLYIPEQTKASLILRYLEYGGENVRPTHLISNVRKEMINIFSMKED